MSHEAVTPTLSTETFPAIETVLQIPDDCIEPQHVRGATHVPNTRSVPPAGEVPYGRWAYVKTVPLDDELLCHADIDLIVDDARQGCLEARTKLTTLMSRRSWGRAIHLALYYYALKDVYIDAQDIAQEAVLTAWERMDKALAHPNPFGYLCKATEGAMLKFCREDQSMVRVPLTSQRRGHQSPHIDSLDSQVSAHTGLTFLEVIHARELMAVAEEEEEYYHASI